MLQRTIAVLMLCGGAYAQAQKAPPAPPTMAQLEDRQLSSIEGELVPLAEAMPADKFNFVPTQGEFKTVRTFALQARHVATTLYMIGASLQKVPVPVDAGKDENGSNELKTKDAIVKYLKDAFAFAHKGMLTLTSENALEMIPSPFGGRPQARAAIAATAVWHSFDHYGQMVVYLRMNGIVPPASR